jgi:NADPH:quinone reductase-like Zn-dependent oxidoreductase
VGEAVSRPQPGDRVVGVGNGAFAEPARGRGDAGAARLDGGGGAGLVANWPTALATLKPLGGITAGQTVLIHAAAGATGQAAVTMATGVLTPGRPTTYDSADGPKVIAELEARATVDKLALLP